MPWPFRAKPKNSIFQIDRYKLDSPIEGLAELAEFSQSEYETMGRKFHGERNYNGPPVSFLGRPWKLMLGTVNGNIYKIAVYLELDGKQEANPIAIQTLQYCMAQLGKPSKRQTGLFIWDAVDGNVVLQTAELASGLDINLFLTSSAVQNFDCYPLVEGCMDPKIATTHSDSVPKKYKVIVITVGLALAWLIWHPLAIVLGVLQIGYLRRVVVNNAAFYGPRNILVVGVTTGVILAAALYFATSHTTPSRIVSAAFYLYGLGGAQYLGYHPEIEDIYNKAGQTATVATLSYIAIIVLLALLLGWPR